MAGALLQLHPEPFGDTEAACDLSKVQKAALHQKPEIMFKRLLVAFEQQRGYSQSS